MEKDLSPPALPHGTSEFVVQHPPLWPQHRRLQGTTIALSVMILAACGVKLFRTSQKRNWKAKAGGLRKTDAARSKSWLWVLERLYVIDILASIARASFVVWMSHRTNVTKWSEQTYTALAAIDGFFLCITQIGIVFILSEFDVLFWGQPGQRVERQGVWYILPRICNFFGWIMAFGLTSIQISVSIVKQYGATGLPWSEHLQSFGIAQDAVTLDVLKILLFLVGFLVLAPYYVVGGPWLWANLITTTAIWTWRLTRVIEKRGQDETSQLVTSLVVDFFFSRIPTLFALAMFSRILSQRR